MIRPRRVPLVFTLCKFHGDGFEDGCDGRHTSIGVNIEGSTGEGERGNKISHMGFVVSLSGGERGQPWYLAGQLYGTRIC